MRNINLDGDLQLLDLIAKNYYEIKKLVTWENFKAKLPPPPEWYLVESQIEGNTVRIPKELEKLPIVSQDSTGVYFDKGVDSTGQIYSIKYSDKELILEYDGGSESTSNPVLQDYKSMKKNLTKYLKSLETEA